MRAITSNGPGQPLQLVEMPDPIPQQGEVLVRLKAAALNHRDLFVQNGAYADMKYPIIPGSDGAGTIEKPGEDVKNFSIGQEVVINPALHWGNNPRAAGKDFEILGWPDNGTFAELVSVPASAIYPKPSHLSFEETAALPLAGLTGYRALVTRGSIEAGQKLLMPGIGGGVALMILKFAGALGAEVYVTSGSDDKIKKALGLGAKAGVNYKNDRWDQDLKEMTEGFDVIVDTVAGNGFDKLLDLAKPGGKVIVFGATGGPIPQLNSRKIYLKYLDILGTTMGSPEDFAGMLKLVSDHIIRPEIDEVLPLEEAEQAMQKIANGTQFGKIVLRTG